MTRQTISANIGLTLLCACLAGSADRSASAFEELIQQIPAGANALVLIDVEKTLASPLAQSQGWDRQLDAAYAEKPIYLSPSAKKLALAAVMRPDDSFLSIWEIAIMQTREAVSMPMLARSEGGYVDQIQSKSTAWTPTRLAYVPLGSNLLGVVYPAERQFVSRWISFTESNSTPVVSDYLRYAATLVTDESQMLYAADLTDVTSPRDLQQNLTEADDSNIAIADAAAAARVFASLRGAILRVAVGDKCQGQLQVDFSESIAPIKDSAQQLVLAELQRQGMETAEISQWSVTTRDKSVLMRGDLSSNSMRRLFSVIETPKADLSASQATPGADPHEPSDSEIRANSQAYFKEIDALLEDVKHETENHHSNSTPGWLERYARRIDQLPVLYVDEALVEYGDKLAETLRIMATSQKQAGVRVGVRKAQSRANDGYGYYYSLGRERQRVTKEEMADAQNKLLEGQRLISDNTADIRRKMTQKYNVEF